MAHSAPSESVFQEARSGPPAGSDGVDGLCAQLKDNRTAHMEGRWGTLASRLRLNVFLPFQHENSVNVKGTSEFLQV
ncbi:hypothetical protein D623_10030636 [Myotis brandtii]|uniref:Uncharacterized protein n=1 Tax=Myotis brandtii TaxID=109478 RepID=S7P8F8_MYOBR|nr:hypothetical protein D623_10030636 [Myotis brandtii]